MKKNWIGLALLWLLSSQAGANELMRNVEVTRIGSYQVNTDHFVWFTATTGECKAANPGNPVMHFNETQPGGKALLAILMTALVNKRKTDVQGNGCEIFEVYLR
ncbi:hypothetical protein QSH18_00700 [Xanthomonas sp. NCPPB 2654]|uniref:hypothetical protein n=1 Tax=unclassified Xanthomonas TaxID=2643310 RepID=UPI0021E003CC|nr:MULTISPECIES: hypothetical protein [unclassified Xanthomonas]MDL5364120.1 hypothetical protein [Xanthomonas sp. NCPPB 2654]UYC20885.1 hypothetical protein NUG20_00820 [Xanthomonas sp. CFBP 8443]